MGNKVIEILDEDRILFEGEVYYTRVAYNRHLGYKRDSTRLPYDHLTKGKCKKFVFFGLSFFCPINVKK